MDQATFDACLDSGRFAAQVNDNLREGQEDGVSSTPTVFINGRSVMGAAPYAVFEQIIEEELARARP
jgi:protein-disulfide isomerase